MKKFLNYFFGKVEKIDEGNENTDYVTQKKLVSQWKIDANMARVFFVVLIASFVLALIPSLRPTYSEAEKRDLKQFPEFSFEALVSGDYFDDISLWFSDTFPLRDTFMQINTYITDAFGANDIKIHGDVDKGDDIPDPIKPDENTSSNTNSDDDMINTLPPPSTPEEPGDTVEKLGAVLVIDNAGYEYYSFGIKTANQYIANMNKAASIVQGKANFYNIVVPTSMAITAPDDIAQSVNSADQKKAIDYIYNSYSSDVLAVDIYPTLRQHRDEYLYFRTDHHWTALGAYYAYSDLMTAMCKPIAPLNSFKIHKFEGFLGSFYSSSGKLPQLAATPDTVFAYEPPQFNKIVTTLQTGQVVNKSIISNGYKMSAGSKYLAFITGDQPLGVMTNPDINDGSACIVVKESFGNCFVPFLTQNYQTVYVVDYRYFNKVDERTLGKFVEDTKAQDVIFINNISATRNRALVDYMGLFIGEEEPTAVQEQPTSSLTAPSTTN